MQKKSQKKSQKSSRTLKKNIEKALLEAQELKNQEPKQSMFTEPLLVEPTLETKPIDGHFLRKLFEKEKESTLEVVSNHEDLLKDKEGFQPKPPKTSNIEYDENGTIKVKGPIRKCLGNGRETEAFKPKEKLDINSPAAKRILSGYGSENYIASLEFFSSSQPRYMGVNNSQYLFTGIPNVDVRILDPETEEAANTVKTGREFYEKNKDEMKEQMNVVAFYSIKDSKPFYYVSSAEARLAVDYIAMCRQCKKDIFKNISETIRIFVHPIHTILNGIKEKNVNVPRAIVWEGIANNCLGETYLYPDGMSPSVNDRYSDIKKISKQLFNPQKVESKIIEFIKFEVVVGGISITNVKNIISLHEPLTLLAGHFHYMILGKNLSRCVNTDLIQPNSMEKEIFGMVGKYKDGYGPKDVFINNQIGENSIIFVSRTPNNSSGNEILSITEYEVIGQREEVRQKDINNAEDAGHEDKFSVFEETIKEKFKEIL